MPKRHSEKATLLEGENIIEEMMNGTFVSDTVPINIAHEVESLIQNFGIDNAAEVAATMAETDHNDPDRVRDWKEVGRVILKRQAEQSK